MRQVVLDTETTGLDPSHGHRLIEIGCIEIVGRRVTSNQFHTYLNPQRKVDEGAFAVHGISDNFLSDKPTFIEKVLFVTRKAGTQIRTPPRMWGLHATF